MTSKDDRYSHLIPDSIRKETQESLKGLSADIPLGNNTYTPEQNGLMALAAMQFEPSNEEKGFLKSILGKSELRTSTDMSRNAAKAFIDGFPPELKNTIDLKYVEHGAEAYRLSVNLNGYGEAVRKHIPSLAAILQENRKSNSVNSLG